MILKNVYKQIIKHFFDELKKQIGFIVNKNVAFYTMSDIAIMIKPALFRFNTDKEISFWFDVYVFLLIEPVNESDISKDILLKKAHLILKERWSFLWGDPYSQYTILEDGSSNDIIPQVDDMLEKYLIPFCKRIKDFEALIGFLEEYQSKRGVSKFNFNVAVGLAKINQLDRSKGFFARAEGDKIIIKNIAASYNIEMD